MEFHIPNHLSIYYRYYHDNEWTVLKNLPSCADIFEAIVAAVYIHLENYPIDPINYMIGWFKEIWNIDYVIDDIIQNPTQENICGAIQKSYQDIIAFDKPNLDYITSNYDKLKKIYEYYKLGKVEMLESYNNRSKMWTIKIVCPLTLGCQYFVDKQGDTKLIGVQSNYNKQQAIENASLEALNIISNDYYELI